MALTLSGTDGVVGTGATFSGNVSIGGTLTYEDVTNVDSVGVITARQGIFIDDSITHIGDTDTKIRFPDNDQISFETNGTQRMIIGSGGAIAITDTIQHTGDVNTKIRFPENDVFSVETGGNERIRIASDGKVGIGTSTPISTLDVKGAIVANGSYYERSYGVAGSATFDKTITFNSQGVILVLINLSLGNTTTEFSRNIYSLGLFTPRSNGATWTAIQQDLNSSHVGNFTISDAGTAGALRVEKSSGSDNRQCTFRVDVLSSANTQFTVTDT